LQTPFFLAWPDPQYPQLQLLHGVKSCKTPVAFAYHPIPVPSDPSCYSYRLHATHMNFDTPMQNLSHPCTSIHAHTTVGLHLHSDSHKPWPCSSSINITLHASCNSPSHIFHLSIKFLPYFVMFWLWPYTCILCNSPHSLRLWRPSKVMGPSCDNCTSICHPGYLVSGPLSWQTWDLRVSTLFLCYLSSSYCVLMILWLLCSCCVCTCSHSRLRDRLQLPYLQIPSSPHPDSVCVPVTLWFNSL